MKIDFENAKIYVRPGSTDLRKGATGLAQIIENEMKLNALSESVFLFCNKNHKLLKVIFWNKTGFGLHRNGLKERHGHGQIQKFQRVKLRTNSL